MFPKVRPGHARCDRFQDMEDRVLVHKPEAARMCCFRTKKKDVAMKLQ